MEDHQFSKRLPSPNWIDSVIRIFFAAILGLSLCSWAQGYKEEKMATIPFGGGDGQIGLEKLKSDVGEFDENGKLISRYISRTEMDVDAGGNIYVSDSINHVLYIKWQGKEAIEQVKPSFIPAKIPFAVHADKQLVRAYLWGSNNIIETLYADGKHEKSEIPADFKDKNKRKISKMRIENGIFIDMESGEAFFSLLLHLTSTAEGGSLLPLAPKPKAPNKRIWRQYDKGKLVLRLPGNKDCPEVTTVPDFPMHGVGALFGTDRLGRFYYLAEYWMSTFDPGAGTGRQDYVLVVDTPNCRCHYVHLETKCEIEGQSSVSIGADGTIYELSQQVDGMALNKWSEK
jgi:hypothetical protein